MSELLEHAKHQLQYIFLGSRIFGRGEQLLFKAELAKITRRRTQVACIAVIAIQMLNLILESYVNIHGEYLHLFRIGEIYLLALSIVGLVLFSYLEYTAKGGLMLRSISPKLYWFLLLIGSLPFVYGDMLENGSVSNVTIFALATGVMPLLNVGESLIYLVLYATANIIIVLNTSAQPYIIQQIIVLCVIALYVSQMLYLQTRKIFDERQKLNKSNQALQRIAHVDQLTGVYNRRGLEISFRKLIGPRRRHGEYGNVCMLMIDIDYFKYYNDKYLHLEGDKCLARIADCLKSCARRATDIIARFGGEEFVLAAQGLEPDELVAFCLKIHRAIENMKIPFEYGEDFPFITVSIGAAQKPVDSSVEDIAVFLRELISEADQQLYNAKASGRNCVSVANNIYR
jgi:diguanylate cyclase (GGDEF)-like protein